MCFQLIVGKIYKKRICQNKIHHKNSKTQKIKLNKHIAVNQQMKKSKSSNHKFRNQK
jgi:hypothetical protein